MLIASLGSDFWLVTTEGRILSTLLAVYGLAVFGYITATFASFFVGRDAEEPQAPVAGAADIRAPARGNRSFAGDFGEGRRAQMNLGRFR